MALRVGLLDHPDGRRKLQTGAVPKAGGTAVLTATLITLSVGAALWPGLTSFLSQDARFWSLLAAAGFMGLVGLLDDCAACAAGTSCSASSSPSACSSSRAGVYVDTVNLFGVEDATSAFWGWPFTVFWLLGAINALNLIDGMDGLLGAVGLIICLAPGRHGRASPAQLAVVGRWPCALAGGLLGFLRVQPAAGDDLPGRLRQHAHRPGRRGAGHSAFAQGPGDRRPGWPRWPC